MADMYDEYDDEDAAPEDQSALTQAYLNTTLQRKNEAKAQMEKLIRALDARRNMPFDPMLMRVAGALLQPTKTGSAGESIGYAASAAADEAEKQALRGVDIAKMEFELGEKMRQQQQGVDALQLAMAYEQGTLPPGTPNLGAPPAPAAAPAPGALPQAEPEADRIGQIAMGAAPTTEMPPAAAPAAEMPLAAPSAAAAPTAAPVTAPSSGPLPPARRRAPDITPGGAVGFALKTGAPEYYAFRKEQEELNLRRRDLEQKGYKPITIDGNTVLLSPGQLRRFTNMQNKGDAEGINKFYKNLGLPSPFVKEEDGTYRVKTSAEKTEETELAKGIETKPYPIPEVGGDVRLLPKQYRAYQRAVEEGKGEEWVDKNIRRKPAGGEAPKTEVKPFQTEEERIVEQERRKRIAEERAKSEVKSRDEIIANAKTATVIEKPANQIFKIASDPIKSKALGLLENPDVFSAIAGATAEGVRAGPINIGIPAIRDAVAKVSGDPKEREQILDALQMLGRNYSEIELNFTRLYLKGEGAVTEGERAIVRQVSGGVGNRRTVALAQTETLLQRAAFDKAVKTEYLRWEKANPNKSIDEFSESTGYKNLVKNLDQNTDVIYDKYFGGKKEPKGAEPKAAPQAAPATGGSLREQIDAAKKARGLK